MGHDGSSPTAVILALIFMCYFLKMIRVFPNKLIPLANFAVGIPLGMLLIGWPGAGDMLPTVRWPDYAAIATALVRCFLLSVAAWLLHTFVLKKIIDNKIPAMNPARKVDKKTETSEHTDVHGTAKTTETETVVTDAKEGPKT